MLTDIVRKGSTDRSVLVRVIDATTGLPETAAAFNTTGVDLWYRREGATRTAITEATLATTDAAHADGGFIHVSDGYCRLDLPDAAFATGANYVDFGGTFTDMIVIGGRVRLIDISLEDAVRAGLTALPNAAAEAAGGLITNGSGTGQLTVAGGRAKIQGSFQINTEVVDYTFTMTDNVNHNALPSLGDADVVVSYSHDGGETYTSLGFAEEGTLGSYYKTLTAAAMNAPVVYLRMTGTGADVLTLVINTTP